MARTKLIKTENNTLFPQYIIQEEHKFLFWRSWTNAETFQASDDKVAEQAYELWKKKNEVITLKED